MSSEKFKVYEADLEKDFAEDPNNANRGTQRGLTMLEKSIGEMGAARSMVSDANGLIPAGNKTRAALIDAGITSAVVVEVDGKTPVVVKRRDWDLTDKRSPARKYAYYDNRVAEIDLLWDPSQIERDLADGVEMRGLFSDDEIAKILGTEEEPGGISGSGVSLAERFLVPPFSVLDARQGYWQDRKRAWISLGIRSETGRGDNLINRSPQELLCHYTGLKYDEARKIVAAAKKKLGDAFDVGALIAEHGGRLPGASSGRLTWAPGTKPLEELDEVSRKHAEVTGGTSIFDPVLCELAYRWFAPAGGAVLDPFAGGSVRGLMASMCGLRYVGIDLRAEQVAANRTQLHVVGAQADPIEPVSDPAAKTPIEQRGELYFKRDDAFRIGEANGGKVRAMMAMLRDAKGVVACGSRESTQLARAAQVAAALGIPCRVHTAAGKDTSETMAARAAGAEVVAHRPGYLAVVKARAREDAAARGWTEIPWGMEAREAIAPTAAQVAEFPAGAKRLVVPVGSGMTLAAILHGMDAAGVSLPILGVMVGGDPRPRLATYAPPGWEGRVHLAQAKQKYEERAPVTSVEGLELDPIYEAKCIPFLEPGDVLWIVGIRSSARRADPSSFPKPTWHCGDSRAMDSILPADEAFDLVFSCPPYFDLEQYSDDPNDLSNAGNYEKFVEAYREIIQRSVRRLRDNRFACFVVGDVRDKKGLYRNFVSDTIAAFEDAGAMLYNEAILVTAGGTLPLRVAHSFPKGRKLGKTHQNVLVFWKGDPAKVADSMTPIEVELPDAELVDGPGEDA